MKKEKNFSLIKSVLISVLTSWIVASWVSSIINKNSELETRTYELKYEVYKELVNDLAQFDKALHYDDFNEVIEAVEEIKSHIPNILLVTNNRKLVQDILEIYKLIEDSNGDSIWTEKKNIILKKIMWLTLALSDDFSNYVTTDSEKESLLNLIESKKNNLKNKLKK